MSKLGSGGGSGSASPVDATEDTGLAACGDNILHLHCEGADNGTVFADVAPNPATITRTGTIVTSTSQFKFGTSALAMGNASGNRLSADLSRKVMPYFGDWTAEAWIYLTATTGADMRVLVSPGSGPTLWLNSAGAPQFYSKVRDGGLGWDINFSSNFNLTTGSWHHVAWVKYRESYMIMVDGDVKGTVRTPGATFWDSSIAIGDPFTNGGINGYIDEVRISRGAKYVGTFSPSATAFPDATALTAGAKLGEIRSDGSGGLWICENAASSPQGWRRLNGPGYLVA